MMLKSAGFKEFVALMALSISLVALSIDAMLPALANIANDLNVRVENDRQLILTVLFFGLAVGQIFYGPISDSFGRRRPVFFGFGLFIVGSLLATLAQTFEALLVGRFLQGLGAAGPRIITLAIVRDMASGREMARIMSLVMMVFILVPAIAPALGQVVLLFAGWRSIFGSFIVLAVGTIVWFHLRQPETLSVENRQPFSIKVISRTFAEIFRTRSSVFYTLAAGMVFGSFIGFLNSAQQILQELYDLGEQFPAYFAVLALMVGSSAWVNSKLVVRFGMRLLCRVSLIWITILSTGFLMVCFFITPSLWMVMAYLMIAFFATGILFGNFNALAMEPLGHIAGTASSLIGSMTTFISLALGFLIGGFYNYTVIPLVSGFALLSFLSLILTHFAEGPSPKVSSAS